MNDLRIYVACLASYNNGRLHGEWFDLDVYLDEGDLYDAVKEQVLLTSPYPNVMVECPACGGDGINPNEHDNLCKTCHGTGEVPSAEEFAIHDHEGFPEGSVGEYTPFKELYRIKEHLEKAEEEFGDNGEEILTAFEHCFGVGLDDDEVIKKCREAYRGEYRSNADFCEEWARELGLVEVSSPIYNWIDFDKAWNCEMHYDFVEHDGHYFYRNW